MGVASRSIALLYGRRHKAENAAQCDEALQTLLNVQQTHYCKLQHREISHEELEEDKANGLGGFHNKREAFEL